MIEHHRLLKLQDPELRQRRFWEIAGGLANELRVELSDLFVATIDWIADTPERPSLAIKMREVLRFTLDLRLDLSLMPQAPKLTWPKRHDIFNSKTMEAQNRIFPVREPKVLCTLFPMATFVSRKDARSNYDGVGMVLFRANVVIAHDSRPLSLGYVL